MVLAPIFNLRRQSWVDISEFKASLVYTETKPGQPKQGGGERQTETETPGEDIGSPRLGF